MNTGLAFAPNVSNLISVRVGGSMFPFPSSSLFKRFQAGTDLLAFAKYQDDAPIDELTTDDRFLGWEPDVYVNWQVTSDLTLVFRYGVFFPSDNAFTSDDSRQYIYGGLTYAF